MKSVFKLKKKLITALAVLFISSTLLATSQIQDTQSVQSQSITPIDIHFIDTGNSDSILISDNGKYMLIDGADNDDEKLIVDYLNNLKIKKIDYLILTHPDADHAGGLDAVVKNFEIGSVFVGNGSADTKTYKDFLQEAINKKMKPSIPLSDRDFTLGKGKFKFYNMKSLAKDVNDRSLVMLYTNGSNKFLFTGDAGAIVEKELPLKEIGKIDVLKVGHHGSKTSSSKAFIDTIKPTYGVICVGLNNTYGHPNNDVLDILANAGTKIYRTDLNGTILAQSDGTNITFSTTKNNVVQSITPSTTKSTPTVNPIMKPITPVANNQTINKNDIVYTTKTGTKYHKDGCSHLSKSKIKTTIADVEKKGLEPCNICYPKQ